MAEKPWADMTPAEKRTWRIDKWRNPDIEWASPEAEAEYKARVDRIAAAVNLEKPDRVPVSLMTGFWPAISAGISQYEAMTDPQRGVQAWIDFNHKFKPDTMVDPVMNTVPTSLFETLDYRLYSWPGHGIPKDTGYQYNEKEWMLREEYDHLISDPSDYMFRTWLPRTVGAFSGFANLSSAFDFIELPFVSGHVMGWGSPEMRSGLERLLKSAEIVDSWWADWVLPGMGRLMADGFPAFACCGSKAPFDILGDTLRGTRGLMTDLYRCPDKVKAACERLVGVAVDWTLRRPAEPTTPFVFMPLHKGADGFMSDEQFRTFYWPTLREVMLGFIEQGLIPFLFAEGHYGSRLEIITDLPKGSTVWLFDQTDMAHAKATIGQVACIRGNVPLSMLVTGTAEQVANYTRGLIGTAGKDGGFILDMGAVGEGGKDENLHAMIQTAWDYGVY